MTRTFEFVRLTWLLAFPANINISIAMGAGYAYTLTNEAADGTTWRTHMERQHRKRDWCLLL